MEQVMLDMLYVGSSDVCTAISMSGMLKWQ